MPVPLEFETARLRLRQLGEADLDALARLNADPRFMRHLGPPMTREDTWRQLAMLLGHWTLRGYGMWAVELKATGSLIGRLGLHRPEGWPGLEVGWALDPDHWGRGLATEGGRAALHGRDEEEDAARRLDGRGRTDSGRLGRGSRGRRALRLGRGARRGSGSASTPHRQLAALERAGTDALKTRR